MTCAVDMGWKGRGRTRERGTRKEMANGNACNKKPTTHLGSQHDDGHAEHAAQDLVDGLRAAHKRRGTELALRNAVRDLFRHRLLHHFSPQSGSGSRACAPCKGRASPEPASERGPCAVCARQSKRALHHPSPVCQRTHGVQHRSSCVIRTTMTMSMVSARTKLMMFRMLNVIMTLHAVPHAFWKGT